MGVTVNQRWRICFEFRRGDAYEVEITDYHKG
jgi:proteic killer suppression protein